MHSHHWPSVLHVLGVSDFVRRDPDGAVGSVVGSAPLSPHSLTNVITRQIRVIAFEIRC